MVDVMRYTLAERESLRDREGKSISTPQPTRQQDVRTENPEPRPTQPSSPPTNLSRDLIGQIKYLPLCLAMGTCPDEPRSFFMQQYR